MESRGKLVARYPKYSIDSAADIVAALKEMNMIKEDAETKSIGYYATDAAYEDMHLYRGMRCVGGKVVFTLSGYEDEVKIHAREIMYNHGITNMFVISDSSTNRNVKNNHWLAYDFYLNGTRQNMRNLTTMFWYMGKVFGEFDRPDEMLRLYGHVATDLYPVNRTDGADKPSLGMVLSDAVEGAIRTEHFPVTPKYSTVGSLIEDGVDKQHWTGHELNIHKVMSNQRANMAAYQASYFKLFKEEPVVESEDEVRSKLNADKNTGYAI